jgi:hypothetical protein
VSRTLLLFLVARGSCSDAGVGDSAAWPGVASKRLVDRLRHLGRVQWDWGDARSVVRVGRSCGRRGVAYCLSRGLLELTFARGALAAQEPVAVEWDGHRGGELVAHGFEDTAAPRRPRCRPASQGSAGSMRAALQSELATKSLHSRFRVVPRLAASRTPHRRECCFPMRARALAAGGVSSSVRRRRAEAGQRRR